MIGVPPSAAGAVQLSATALSRAEPVTPVGAPGRPATEGVTEAEAAESAPVPTPLIAATLNVYAVPFARPVTLELVSG